MCVCAYERYNCISFTCVCVCVCARALCCVVVRLCFQAVWISATMNGVLVRSDLEVFTHVYTKLLGNYFAGCLKVF